MITVYNSESSTQLGYLAEADLAFLINQLEEESVEDQDYYIDTPTVDYLAANGASADLLKLLREAIGDGDSVTLLWRRTDS